MREAILRLQSLGSLPSESESEVPQLVEFEELVTSIIPPVSDEEAQVLVGVFGPDETFGAVWTLIHLIETAPGWPLLDALSGNVEGVKLLRVRARNAGYDIPQMREEDDLEFGL